MKNMKILLAALLAALVFDSSGLGVPPDRNLECSGYDLSSVPNNDKESARKSSGRFKG
jgi:hypothetical protein